MASDRDLYAREVENYTEGLAPPEERATTEPVSDYSRSALLHATSPANFGMLVSGTVHYAAPLAHWYKVFVSQLGAEMPCCCLSSSGTTPFSVRDTSALSPGNEVLLWVSPSKPYGIILGSLPSITQDKRLAFHDWIFQGSNVGFLREAYYHELMSLCVDSAGMLNFSSDRPIDGLSTAEWGKITSTGTCLIVDPFMVSLRAFDDCGIWLHLFDRHMRITGHSLDLSSAAMQFLARNDRGEALLHRGATPYPWEALGALSPEVELHKSNSAEEVQRNLPVGKLEPVEEDQIPFWRLDEHGCSYLGQGGFRALSCPPPNSDGQLWTYSADREKVGLFREQLGLDGSWWIATAHSFGLIKRTVIAVPRTVAPPEHPNGDNNYRGSGHYTGEGNNGPQHKISNIQSTSRRLGASDILDFVMHTFEWKGLHPFLYHEHDYAVPGPDEDPVFESAMRPPEFLSLATETACPLPDPVRVNIDHRYGEQEYFETMCGVFSTPAGGINIFGGCGETIALDGGSILLSAPGDIIIRNGRNMIVWSGQDVVLRARHSVDITSSLKDVRIKAEKNLEMLAANSGTGRLLLESRNEEYEQNFRDLQGEDIDGAGIQVRCKSFISLQGKDLYFRSRNGEIILDADQGRQNIRIIGKELHTRLQTKQTITFPATGSASAVYTISNHKFETPGSITAIRGISISQGGLRTNGSIQIAAGHIYSSSVSDEVGALVQQPLAEVRQHLRQVGSDQQLALDQVNSETESFHEKWYTEDKPGSDSFWEYSIFSLRTPAQMGSKSTTINEDYWQHIARLSSQSLEVWEEPAVIYGPHEQYPHPGESWKQPTMVVRDPKFFDIMSGQPKARSAETYNDLAEAEPTNVTPASAYKVIP